MSSRWILDGYNVMYAWQQLPSFQSLELTRDRFIHGVSQWQALGDQQLTIVFDSQRAETSLQEEYRGLQILYSSSGANADGMIMNLIRQTLPSLRRSLTVVTKDLLLRDAIFSYGCIVLSPEAFWQEFHRVRSQVVSRQAKLKPFYRPFEDFFQDRSLKNF